MRLLRASMLTVVLMCISSTGVSAQRPPSPSRPSMAVSRATVAARVDSLAEAFIHEPQAPGVSISVIRAGRDTLVYRGYGLSDIENNVAAIPATVYRIGSITKQFTSAAVMRLEESGKNRLDDSIAPYLTQLPRAWHRVTLRQLLNHTSGIPDYTESGESWVRRWGEDMPPDTILALVANTPMDFAPGTRWKYDNTGYVLLGMLLEKISGHPYASFVDSTLFRPLGLTSTSYCDDGPIIPHRARGYDREGRTYKNTAYLNMSQPFSAGSLCSTIGDLARWNRALATGHVVSAASYQQMTTPEGAASAHHYGFGLDRDTLGGHAMIQHGGGINGFLTANAYLPEDSLSVTVLTNAVPNDPDALLANVARAALGLPLVQRQPPPKPVALPPAERSAIAGTYVFGLPGKELPMTIRSDTGGVTAQVVGQSAFPLTYVGNDTFRAEVDPTMRLRFVMENGRAVRLEFTQRGDMTEALRRP